MTTKESEVDVLSEWVPENLDRCCTELTNLINLQDDYDFDEMTVATFQTAIECIRVCEAALRNAGVKS